jgi:23S rRNA G2069 N7-methylase RlmK/C1962 C5-methylase RlmI
MEARLLDMAGPLEGRRLLTWRADGGHRLAAASRGAMVTGVDLTPRMIQIARKRARRAPRPHQPGFSSAT